MGHRVDRSGRSHTAGLGAGMRAHEAVFHQGESVAVQPRLRDQTASDPHGEHRGTLTFSRAALPTP